MAKASDLLVGVQRDAKLALYWAGWFRRHRIEYRGWDDIRAWRAAANRLAEVHDENYGEPRRQRRGLSFFVIAEIERMIGEGKSLRNACSYLCKGDKRAADALRKAYERHRKGLGR